VIDSGAFHPKSKWGLLMHCRFVAAGVLAFLSFSSAAMAGECAGNPDALGTSRVLTLDPKEFRRIGTIQYQQTLPLEDHEVVLTFDDGPIPPHTNKVLDALAAECVKATFFVVGEMARAHPATLQRAYREGHSIGTHTEHHANLDHLSAEKAQKEISDGVESAAQVLGDKNAVAPFFRFPYLDHTGAIEDRALQLGLSIWSADLHASDWTRINAEKVTALALSRLESKHKGILLLHDIHERTASALPVLLRELKKKGYRIVHVVPASGAVAKIEEKPDAKTEQAANVQPDEKAPVKTEQAALTNPEQGPAEKVKRGTPANLDQKSPKNADQGGWRTHIKRSRQAKADSKGDPFQNFFHALWHR
jgi:peptidoglycan/xylan/chitin deacetylase (PgdA/CDA1 family)